MKNYCVAVREWNDEIIFVRTVIPGAADRSYGIHVARLAGLPESVVRRAQEILADLEQTNDEFRRNFPEKPNPFAPRQKNPPFPRKKLRRRPRAAPNPIPHSFRFFSFSRRAESRGNVFAHGSIRIFFLLRLLPVKNRRAG